MVRLCVCMPQQGVLGLSRNSKLLMVTIKHIDFRRRPYTREGELFNGFDPIPTAADLLSDFPCNFLTILAMRFINSFFPIMAKCSNHNSKINKKTRILLLH